jgi:ABC-type nitrate/sulfonate/bicarbonate transport system substrate-binding protein
MRRRHSRYFAALLGAVVSFAQGAFDAGAAEQERAMFRMGESAPANTYLAIWMAEDAGLYTAQGLDFEIAHMVGGAGAASELEAGNIQLMHVGMSSVVRANALGADLRTIGSLSNVLRFTLFTAPGIDNAEDLRGGTIGISSTGSESDATSTLALQRLGLSRADVTFVEIGRDRLPFLQRGEVTASMLGEPSRTEAFELGLNPIVDLYADRIPWLFSGLVVDADYLQSGRDTLLRFLRATIEGNYLALSDEARAKAVLARELGLADAALIDASYQNFADETPANVEIDLEGARNVLNAVSPPGAGPGLDAYLDLTLLEELRASGFLAEMADKYHTP